MKRFASGLAAVGIGVLLWVLFGLHTTVDLPRPPFEPPPDLASGAKAAFGGLESAESLGSNTRGDGGASADPASSRKVALGLISGRVLSSSGAILRHCDVLLRPENWPLQQAQRVALDGDGYFAVRVPYGRRYILAPVSKTHCVWPPRSLNVAPDGEPIAVYLYEMLNIQVHFVAADGQSAVAVPGGFAPTVSIAGVEVEEHPSQDLSPELWRRADDADLDASCILIARVLSPAQSRELSRAGSVEIAYRYPGMRVAASRISAVEALSGIAAVKAVVEPAASQSLVRFDVRYESGEKFAQSFFLECRSKQGVSQTYWMREPLASRTYLLLEPGAYEAKVGALSPLYHTSAFSVPTAEASPSPIDVRIAIRQRPDVLVSLLDVSQNWAPFYRPSISPEGETGVPVESGASSAGEPYRFVDVWPGVYSVSVRDRDGKKVELKGVRVEGSGDVVVALREP